MITVQKAAINTALVAALVGGGAYLAMGYPVIASSTGSQSSTDSAKGGHQANGITEQLLTGTTATRVKNAVLAANPGATVHRVETDAEGAVYEAHITKADGSRATVKLDGSFNITATQAGHGLR
ncbi:UNVERIFIED_ORG: putative membrane protein YkoI [Arthrobacter globiformis]|nr:putative membrane protein YkoI [Arthrobacter globiformis]